MSDKKITVGIKVNGKVEYLKTVKVRDFNKKKLIAIIEMFFKANP